MVKEREASRVVVAVVVFSASVAFVLASTKSHLPAVVVVGRGDPRYSPTPLEFLLTLRDLSNRHGLELLFSSLRYRHLSFPNHVWVIVGIGECNVLKDIKEILRYRPRPVLLLSTQNCSEEDALSTLYLKQQQHQHLWPCFGWVLHSWMSVLLQEKASGGGFVIRMSRRHIHTPREMFEECLLGGSHRMYEHSSRIASLSSSEYIIRNTTLTLATVQRPPFTMLRKNHNNEIVSAYGVCISMLELLRESLGFRYTLVEAPDNGFGALKEDGSWNGMVGMVMRKEVDGAVGSFTMNLARSKVIQYTHPYYDEPTGILIPPPTSGDTIAAFLTPFHWQVWLVMGMFLVLVGSLLHFFSTFPDLPLLYPHQGRSAAPLSQYIAWTGQALVSQSNAMRQTAPARVLHAAWWCLVIVLIYSYSGTLIASLTAPRIVKVADSLAELTEQTKISWVVRRGSIHQLLFQHAEEGVYARVNRLLDQRPELLIGSDSEGLDKVRTGNYAFLKEISFLEFSIAADLEANGKCSFGLARKGFFNAHIAWIFQKHSPITAIINTRIIRMAQSGMMTKWQRDFFPPPNECTRPTSMGPRRLSLVDMLGCFTLGGVGMLLAILALIGEFLVARTTPTVTQPN